MNEKSITCHDCHGFNGKTYIFIQYLLFYVQSDTSFGSLDCDYAWVAKGRAIELPIMSVLPLGLGFRVSICGFHGLA